MKILNYASRPTQKFLLLFLPLIRISLQLIVHRVVVGDGKESKVGHVRENRDVGFPHLNWKILLDTFYLELRKFYEPFDRFRSISIDLDEHTNQHGFLGKLGVHSWRVRNGWILMKQLVSILEFNYFR